MKIVIGLGNPGEEYRNNRHNVGFWFVDKLKEEDLEEVKIFKTEGVYMNDSGKFVAERVNFFKILPENLFIVHDDLDIQFGEFKINFGKGPQIHNGLSSIENSLGTDQFWRVRIGIDGRERDGSKLGDSGHDYVLDDFSKEEMDKLNQLYPEILKRLKENL